MFNCYYNIESINKYIVGIIFNRKQQVKTALKEVGAALKEIDKSYIVGKVGR